jgi:hypothetical protein
MAYDDGSELRRHEDLLTGREGRDFEMKVIHKAGLGAILVAVLGVAAACITAWGGSLASGERQRGPGRIERQHYPAAGGGASGVVPAGGESRSAYRPRHVGEEARAAENPESLHTP